MPPKSTFIIAALVLTAYGCEPQHIWMRYRPPSSRVAVPLDVSWEVDLETWGRRGPRTPDDARATCSPRERCKTLVSREGRSKYSMRLAVIALSPGPVDVDLHVQPYNTSSWLTERIHLEFVPAPARPTLEVGMALPRGPFLFAHLPPAAVERGIKAPMRCEHYRESSEYLCVQLVDVLGEKRHPACAHSDRCDGYSDRGVLRIEIELDEETDRIQRFRIESDSGVEFGTWDSDGGHWLDVEPYLGRPQFWAG